MCWFHVMQNFYTFFYLILLTKKRLKLFLFAIELKQQFSIKMKKDRHRLVD
jgi:hypothetical protein